MADECKPGIKRGFDDMAADDDNDGNPQQKQADNSQQGCGKRLKSPQLTVLVGSNKESFLVHESVLKSSTVLAGLYSENDGSSCINLPDDNPEDVGLMLEFLYRDDFPSLGDEEKFIAASEENRNLASDELCRIYGLADKYDLPKLKDCIVGKFGNMAKLKKFPLSFLDSAKKMYDCITDSDNPYPTFFLARTEKLFRKYGSNGKVRKWTEDAMLKGGRLARDIFLAQRKFYETQAAQQSRDIAQWKASWERSQSEVKEGKKTIAKLERHHDERHDSDEYCGYYDLF